MMLSKNKIKFIHSLARKKTREQERVFLVEGKKIVMEAISSGFPIQMLAATREFYAENLVEEKVAEEQIECTEEELKKASLLQTPQQALAVMKLPGHELSFSEIKNKLSLALDGIQDPGNLGTIIRLADWFGIDNLICSHDTADCYNPKVIQASMGAIFRVKVHYLELPAFLDEVIANSLPVYGAFLEGKNIYCSALSAKGILVMGNEGKGISAEVSKKIVEKIHIPSFATARPGSESLNVATATAICCSEFRRRGIQAD